MAVLDVVEDGFGQAKFGYAVAEHPAQLVFALKNGHIIAVSCQDDGDGDAGRTGTDDGGFYAVGRMRPLGHLVGIGGGDVMFDGGEVDRGPLFSQDTVAFALVLVAAHKAADGGERIIFKEDPSGLIQFVVF